MQIKVIPTYINPFSPIYFGQVTISCSLLTIYPSRVGKNPRTPQYSLNIPKKNATTFMLWHWHIILINVLQPNHF